MNECLPELDSAVEELAPMQHSREGGTLLLKKAPGIRGSDASAGG